MQCAVPGEHSWEVLHCSYLVQYLGKSYFNTKEWQHIYIYIFSLLLLMVFLESWMLDEENKAVFWWQVFLEAVLCCSWLWVVLYLRVLCISGGLQNFAKFMLVKQESSGNKSLVLCPLMYLLFSSIFCCSNTFSLHKWKIKQIDISVMLLCYIDSYF